MLGRYLSRILYTRELYLARMASRPSPPHRPDLDVCTQVACRDSVDLIDRFHATTAVREWLGADLPPSVVLCVPNSQHVYLA